MFSYNLICFKVIITHEYVKTKKMHILTPPVLIFSHTALGEHKILVKLKDINKCLFKTGVVSFSYSSSVSDVRAMCTDFSVL